MSTLQDDYFRKITSEWIREPFTNILQLIFEDKTITNFIDIGANVGGVIHSLHSLGYLNKINTVVCFEPDYDNYNYLSRVCQEIQKPNNTNIILHNIGIYYGKTEAIVYGSGDGNIGGYFINDENNTMYLRDFPIVPYTNKKFILANLETYIDFEIDVVKIDIEGSEINLLENSILLKNSKFIILEWHFKTELMFDFILKHLPNFELIYDGGKDTNNYLLKNKNR